MGYKVDSLQLELTVTAKQTASSLNRVANALVKIKKETKDMSALVNLRKELNKFSKVNLTPVADALKTIASSSVKAREKLSQMLAEVDKKAKSDIDFKPVGNTDVIVYDKLYADEDKTEHSFYPDGMVTLLPNAPVGKTWFGTTPEERAALSGANADFALVDGVFSVQVSETVDPVNTKTIASEIVLPSFEGMDSVVVMNVGEVLDKTLTGTVAEGSASGTTKVTLAAAPSGYAYKVSTTTDSLDKIFYGTDLSGWADYTSGDNITIADGKTFAIALVDTTNELAVAAGLFVADSAT